MKRVIVASILLFCLLHTVHSQSKVEVYDVSEYTGKETQKTLQWYKDAKFGMFVHWGLYSGMGEWSRRTKHIPKEEYLKLKEGWAGKFNPDDWTRLAKMAGMKWITVTAKHHDGFAIYPSDYSDFDSEITGYKGDPLKNLKESCDRAGLKLGFYYSQFQDWDHPDGGSHDNFMVTNEDINKFNRYLNEKALPQIKELVTRYHPFNVWYDTSQRSLLSNSLAFRAIVKENSPYTIIPSRIGHELGDYISGGDQGLPNKPLSGLWETCYMSAGGWSYNQKVENYKNEKGEIIVGLSAASVVELLYKTVAGGGVLLLNAGPRKDGTIPGYYFDVWPKVGQWLKVHGEAVYGSDVNPYFRETPVCTTHQNILYAYLKLSDRILGQLILPDIQSEVEEVAVLADKSQRTLTFKKKGDVLIIELPKDESYYYGKDGLADILKIKVKANVSINIREEIFVQKPKESIVLIPKYFGSFQGEKDLSESVSVLYGKREPVYATFKVVTPGKYNFSMNMSAPKGHGGINVRVYNKLFVINEEKNNLPSFFQQSLGTMIFDKPGTYTVLISSAKFVYAGYKSKYPEDVTRDISFKEVLLKPVK
jgi:alpha-L-fucosidase